MPEEQFPQGRRQVDYEVAVLQTEVKHLKETLRDLVISVNKLNEMLQQTKGGWFALSLVGAACVSVGAVAATIFWK